MDFNWNINSCKRLNEYGTITFEILSTTFCSVLEKDNTRGHTAFLEAEIVLIFLDCHICHRTALLNLCVPVVLLRPSGLSYARP